jgi:hypothetical protein
MESLNIRIEEEGECAEEGDEGNDADIEELMLGEHVGQLHSKVA